jgi:flavin-dependent dehydrogenase
MRRIYTDAMFFEAAKNTKNVQTKENFMVQEVIFDKGYAVGVKGIETGGKREEREFFAKVIIGADGVNSAVARSVLGAKATLDGKHSCDAVRGYYKGVSGLTSNIEIHFFESVMPGYFWIFPLENGMANVGIGLVSSDLKKRMASKNKNLITIMNDAIQNEPLIKERFKNAKLEGQISGWRLPFGSHRRQLAGNGWVLVGDAASLVDPFSGEGVGNATASGRIAAETVSDALDDGNISRDMLSCYEREFWEEVGPELGTSYSMQKIGRIKWLINLVVKKAASKKEIKEFISASLANEDAKKNFKNPLFYLKLLLT